MPDQQPDFKTTTTPLDGVVSMSKPTQPKIDWAALAMHAQGALNAQAQIEAQQRALIQQQQTWGQWGINQAARIGGGVVGGMAGSLAGPIGTLAGIGTGAAIGDDWAQGQEVQQGVRDHRNPLETLAAGLTAPLPGGTIARGGRLLPAIGKAIVTAQPANLASSLALQGAEGNGITMGRTVRDMAGSTGLQVGIGTGLRAAQRAPMAATRVAQSPAVQHLLASETGAVGPNIRQVLPQQPDAAPGGSLQATPPPMAPMTMAADGTPTFHGPEGGAVPSRLPEDIDRHIATLKRFGQEDDAINESVFFHSQVASDPMAQVQRGIAEPQSETLRVGEELRQAGAFEVPTGTANKAKFSVEDAAAMRREYAVREEFLSRIREQMGPDLRTRLESGDPEAAMTVQALATKYKVNGIEGLERLKQETALSALEASIADKVVGTAQGRGLALRKARISLKNVPDADFLRVATEKGLPVKEAIEALDTLETPEQRWLALRKLSTPSGQDKWKQVIYTALLSHPATHAVNLEGTSASIIAREALSNTVVTGVDRVRSAVTGAPRQIATPPADMLGKAYYEGLKAGFNTGGFFLKQGYDPARLGESMDVPLEPFTGAVTAPLMQAPTRFLGAADAFMAQPPYWGEVMRRATAKALNDAKAEGLDNAALRDRITHYAKDHELDEDLVKEVNGYVKTALFKQDPGPGTRWAGAGVKLLDDFGNKYLGGAPIGTMLLPFRGTPASIARQGFKAAGGGIITGTKAARRGDSVQATRDIAEAVLGLGLIASIALDLTDGSMEVVGDLPRNEFERESSYRQGMQGWSIKVGDRYYPASSLGPAAIPVAIAASYVQAFKRDPKKPMDAFSTVVAPAIRTLLDSTMLKGTNDFLTGIRDERKSEQLVGRLVTTNIPYAGSLRGVRDQVDPLLRDPGGPGATARALGGDGSGAEGIDGAISTFGRNITEEVEAALPGLSQNIRPRVDSFGEPIARPGTMRRVVGSQVQDDPVRQEMVRLKGVFPTWEDDGIYPGNMDAGITELEGSYRKSAAQGLAAERKAGLEQFRLTDKERTTYKVLVGGAIGDVLTAVVNHPKYAALPDEAKAEVLRNERVRARKMGLEMFKQAIAPDVAKRLRALRAPQ